MRFNNRFPIAVLVCALALASGALAQMSSISYQGKLNDGASSASGPHDFRFRLFDGFGAPLSVAESTADDIQVVNGIFTAELSFDSELLFNLPEAWLEIAVRPGASTGSYTVLSPRQKIGDAPFASKSRRSEFATSAARADEANVALLANEATTAQNAVNAENATNATNAVFATNAGNASTANSATTASTANTANTASNANNAGALGGRPASEYFRFRWTQMLPATALQPNTGYFVTGAVEIVATLPPTILGGEVIKFVASEPGGSFVVKTNLGQSFHRLNGNSRWADTGSSGNRVITSDDGLRVVASSGLASPMRFSEDGGITWVGRSDTVRASQMDGTSDLTKLIAIDASRVFISTDFGNSWVRALESVTSSFIDVAISPDGSVLVAASAASLHVSTNGGTTWTSPAGGANVRAVDVSSFGGRIVAAQGDQVQTSTDQGATFSSINVPCSPCPQFDGVAISDSGNGVVVTSSSSPTFYSTNNAGQSWYVLPNGSNLSAPAVSPDGTREAFHDGTTTYAQSTPFGGTYPPLSGGPAGVQSIAISGNGRRIYVANGRIHVYTYDEPNTRAMRGTGAVELLYTGGGRFVVLNETGATFY